MNLKEMINWDLVDDKYSYALIGDTYIQFSTDPTTQLNPTNNYICRPRKFEDGGVYPVKFKSTLPCKDTATYIDDGAEGLFVASGRNHKKEAFQFIGKKLPDSLWDE